MDKQRNYARFYALIARMQGADKESIVLQYTNGRTTSLKEMTDGEYRLMIIALGRRADGYDKLRSARSAALKQLQRYGIDTTNWAEVDRFCLKPRIAGKRFAQLGIPDLVGLTRKMRAIIDKGERKAMQDEIDQYNQQVAASASNTQLPS
ncbi:MAG: hypothetical protein Q4A64_02515 [Porphyromonadaceae bacterium]|nr:hypothetical protein [Porphyromonadaceae bacterium]